VKSTNHAAPHYTTFSTLLSLPPTYVQMISSTHYSQIYWSCYSFRIWPGFRPT